MNCARFKAIEAGSEKCRVEREDRKRLVCVGCNDWRPGTEQEEKMAEKKAVEKAFICPQCGKVYKLAKRLETHSARCTGAYLRFLAGPSGKRGARKARASGTGEPLIVPNVGEGWGPGLPLEKLSRDRALQAEMEGRSPTPWDDPDRDMISEAAEELADANNYLVWAIMQRLGRSEENALKLAREAVAEAYRALDVAARMRGEGR